MELQFEIPFNSSALRHGKGPVIPAPGQIWGCWKAHLGAKAGTGIQPEWAGGFFKFSYSFNKTFY